MPGCVAAISTAWAYIIGGDLPAAVEQYQLGLRLAQSVGAKRFEVLTLSQLAYLQFKDDPSTAMVMAQTAMELMPKFAQRFFGPPVLSSMATLVNQTDEQDRLLGKGEALLADGCVSHCYFKFYADAIVLMLARGDYAAAVGYADALEAYVREEPLELMALTTEQARLVRALADGEQGEQLDARVARFNQRLRATDFVNSMAGQPLAQLAGPFSIR